MNRKLNLLSIAVGLTLTLSSTHSLAAGKYGPGANDKEVKIGNMVPYSGGASAYGNIGKAISAYFKGINCRSVRQACSPSACCNA